MHSNNQHVEITVELVDALIASQFPQWKDLPIRPVKTSGWDNRTFHLGEKMLIRLPSAAEYALQVEKENHWLPILAPQLPLAIPAPVAIGKPGLTYPWHWSVYAWLPGDTVASQTNLDLYSLAKQLGAFLKALQQINADDGPPAGEHSFYRGGSLGIYDLETRNAINVLSDKLDPTVAEEIWDAALETSWQHAPVWVHGDISAGNLLLQDGNLSAVIDFGQLCIGDPACDLAIAWTLFNDKSREVFREEVALDQGTWKRGRAWALWKALITAASPNNNNNYEAQRCWQIINEILNEIPEALRFSGE